MTFFLLLVMNYVNLFTFEDECIYGGDKCMDCLLVEIDIHFVLLEELELEWRGHVYFHTLDY